MGEQRRLRLERLAKRELKANKVAVSCDLTIFRKQNTLRHVRRSVNRVSTNRLGRNHCGIGIILQQVSLSAIIYSSNMTLCSFNVICEFIINYMRKTRLACFYNEK